MKKADSKRLRSTERHSCRDVLCCPQCQGELQFTSQLAKCGSCGPYPILGDVPVLVQNPFQYCTNYYDAILASLAQYGFAERETVAVVDAFVQAPSQTPQRFGDDWAAHEMNESAAPVPIPGPAMGSLSALLKVARKTGPASWFNSRLHSTDVILELGCGAGERSEVLATHARRLIVGDLSLRAVLRARARAARHEADVVGVVMDAQALPVKHGTLNMVLAEHLVDLLDEPFEFLQQARAVLRKQGELLITTSEPSLGTGSDDALVELAERAKFRIDEQQDGLPWLRLNSSRFIECYLVQALALRRM